MSRDESHQLESLMRTILWLFCRGRLSYQDRTKTTSPVVSKVRRLRRLRRIRQDRRMV